MIGFFQSKVKNRVIARSNGQFEFSPKVIVRIFELKICIGNYKKFNFFLNIFFNEIKKKIWLKKLTGIIF